jgi:hypothetical protein
MPPVNSATSIRYLCCSHSFGVQCWVIGNFIKREILRHILGNKVISEEQQTLVAVCMVSTQEAMLLLPTVTERQTTGFWLLWSRCFQGENELQEREETILWITNSLWLDNVQEIQTILTRLLRAHCWCWWIWCVRRDFPRWFYFLSDFVIRGYSNGLQAGGPVFDSWRCKNFVFFTGSRPTLGPIRSPTSFPGVKAAGTWSWPLASIYCRGQKRWIYTFIHIYIFMA